jgi:L-threonylcarbamoyladenylate synthase
MLKNELLRWGHPVQVRRAESAASPGHLKHHYMPTIPLVIVPDDESSNLSKTTRDRIMKELQLKEIQSPKELKLSEDASQAARELYSEMRKLTESGADLLFVKVNPAKATQGLWSAIWDRLSRAAILNLVSE